jgi:LPXTG-motif cell wall-anchored protein
MRRLVTVLLIVGVVVTTTATVARAAGPDFTLTVDYRGLYPNAQVDVPVTVQNRQSYPIEVQTATAAVGDTPGCPSRNLEVAAFSGHVRVPAGGTAIVPMHFHMLASAPDTCQNATFPLTFRAIGAPASDPSSSTTTSPAASGGGFAFTGSGAGTVTLAVVGAAALLLGGGLLAARRRREALR